MKSQNIIMQISRLQRPKKIENVIVLFLSEPIDNTRERKFQPSRPQGKVIQGYLLLTVSIF